MVSPWENLKEKKYNASLPTYRNLPSPHKPRPPKIKKQSTTTGNPKSEQQRKKKRKRKHSKNPYYKQQLRLLLSIPAALPCNQNLI
jgi:hypothetical protein